MRAWVGDVALASVNEQAILQYSKHLVLSLSGWCATASEVRPSKMNASRRLRKRNTLFDDRVISGRSQLDDPKCSLFWYCAHFYIALFLSLPVAVIHDS